MVKGGVLAPFNTFSAVAMISTSPVGTFLFLLSRSTTVPVTCTTNSRPREWAVASSAASLSALKVSWVMP